MAATPWELSGEYFETCSCNYLCPCAPSNLAAQPTKGSCTFAMVFHVNRGRSGNLALDDLNFAIVGRAPDVMAQGNWAVGLVVDERATPEQRQALTSAASGQAGGPLANLAPLIGSFLGVEAKPIRFEMDGLKRSVSIAGVLDQAIEGVASPINPTEPLCIDNTLHPANRRLGLAKALRSHLHVFGLSWDDASGQNNGHFAPFNWQGS